MRFYEFSLTGQKIKNRRGGVILMVRDTAENTEEKEIDLSSMEISMSTILLGNSWQTWN